MTKALKSILMLVKVQSLVVCNIVKCKKYNTVMFLKFALYYQKIIAISRKSLKAQYLEKRIVFLFNDFFCT